MEKVNLRKTEKEEIEEEKQKAYLRSRVKTVVKDVERQSKEFVYHCKITRNKIMIYLSSD